MNNKYTEFRIQYSFNSSTWYDDETKYTDYASAVRMLDASREQSKAEEIAVEHRLVQRIVEELVFNI